MSEAEEKKKAVKYPDRLQTSGGKPHSDFNQGGSSSSSASSRPVANRSRKNARHRIKISSLALMTKIEQGEDFQCRGCDFWVGRQESYVCKRCGLDNHKHAHRRMIDFSESAIREPVPGINYEEFKK